MARPVTFVGRRRHRREAPPTTAAKARTRAGGAGPRTGSSNTWLSVWECW